MGAAVHTASQLGGVCQFYLGLQATLLSLMKRCEDIPFPSAALQNCKNPSLLLANYFVVHITGSIVSVFILPFSSGSSGDILDNNSSNQRHNQEITAILKSLNTEMKLP